MTRDDLLFGDYLSAARRRARKTQQDVADQIEKHVQFISNIERNISPAPAYVLAAYIKVCKISEKEFLKAMLKKREDWVKENVFSLTKKK